jgi:hypothetical protein
MDCVDSLSARRSVRSRTLTSFTLLASSIPPIRTWTLWRDMAPMRPMGMRAGAVSTFSGLLFVTLEARWENESLIVSLISVNNNSNRKMFLRLDNKDTWPSLPYSNVLRYSLQVASPDVNHLLGIIQWPHIFVRLLHLHLNTCYHHIRVELGVVETK